MIKQVSPSRRGITVIYRRQQGGWAAIYDSEISTFGEMLRSSPGAERLTGKHQLWVVGTIRTVSVLHPYHSHGLSPWYITFIMKANSDSI